MIIARVGAPGFDEDGIYIPALHGMFPVCWAVRSFSKEVCLPIEVTLKPSKLHNHLTVLNTVYNCWGVYVEDVCNVEYYHRNAQWS